MVALVAATVWSEGQPRPLVRGLHDEAMAHV
jgi:hypothetical protein